MREQGRLRLRENPEHWAEAAWTVALSGRRPPPAGAERRERFDTQALPSCSTCGHGRGPAAGLVQGAGGLGAGEKPRAPALTPCLPFDRILPTPCLRISSQEPWLRTTGHKNQAK